MSKYARDTDDGVGFGARMPKTKLRGVCVWAGGIWRRQLKKPWFQFLEGKAGGFRGRRKGPPHRLADPLLQNMFNRTLHWLAHTDR